MKTILVPVDFTITSRNALLYALFLNRHMQAEIILFHAYNVPAYETDIALEIPDHSVREEMLNELMEWKKDAESRYPEMKILAHLSDALTREEIIDEELSFKADLVVFGTQGTDGLAGVFLSDTVTAVEHTRCPVLIVPPAVILGSLEKIVFATDFEEDDIQNINMIIEFARMFDAEVTILHITGVETSREIQDQQLKHFAARLRREINYAKLEFRLLDAGDALDAINDYTASIHADMLAVSMKKMSAFQQLFEKSVKKEMVYHTSIPLLAFHTAYL